MSNRHAAPTHPRHDHERSDTHLKPLFYAALGLVVITLLAMLAMVWMFNLMQDARVASDPSPSPLADTVERPSAPLLQPNSSTELELHRRLERGQLKGYGWVDPETKVVRIPIERAIEILADKGLPYRRSDHPTAEGAQGVDAPGEAK